MYPNQNPNQNSNPNQPFSNPANPQMYSPDPYYSGPEYQQYQQPLPSTPARPRNNSLALIIIIILAVFAIGGVAFGTFTFINSSQEIANLNETISKQESIIQNNTTLTPTDSDNNTNEYIYIGEWGIKIKIPAELSWVGYSFTPSDQVSTISVYGVQGQFDTRPNFLNLPEVVNGLGYVTRAPLGYGSAGGVKIFSNGNYDYFYEISQQAITDDPEAAALEASSKALVESMLTTVENYSPI